MAQDLLNFGCQGFYDVYEGDKLCVNRGIYCMDCEYVMFVFDQ